MISSGSSSSVVAVKSLMSEKKIVSFLRSVWIVTSSRRRICSVELRREIARILSETEARKGFVCLEFLVHARDRLCLAILVDDESEANHGHRDEIGE